MAKKTRKKSAAKTAKKSKTVTKKKGPKKKIAASKARKTAARKKSKPVAKKAVITKKEVVTKAAPRKTIRNPPPESFPHKIARAFNAIADTLTDAEHLDHQLDPGVSREPE